MDETDNPSGGPEFEPTKPAPPKIWQWVVLVLIVCGLIGAAIFSKSATGINFVDGYHSFPGMVEELGWWGPVGIMALMVVHCFVPFPAEFVALAAGSAFGTFYGTVYTWIGAMIGAMLSFGLTRIFGQPFITWALPERQKHLLDRWTEDQGAITLLISRFIPVIAFNLINYAAGLTKIDWKTFFWTTGVGILPLTTLMVYMGAQMRHLSWEWLFSLSAICIAIMAVLHWYRRNRKNIG
ncbi:MAG: TVP38/TMEM64 family protein [Rhizobiaceae bacterium]